MSEVNVKSIIDKFGRYVCPLKRITLNYCRRGGSSRGIREYINNGVKQFAEENPEVSLYVLSRNGEHPRLVANYLNGESRTVEVKNIDPAGIQEWMKRLRQESGKNWINERLRSTTLTDKPSIQGTWDPFMYKPLPRPPQQKPTKDA